MAAGLGFKDFVTGEVLTAADVDGYLMQGVWVFASAAARDAAVTSPQEGNFAYLKDTNVTTYYTGSAWANLDTTGMTNPMTTTGDTIYSSSGSTPARLGIGSTGQVLTVAGGIPSWSTPAGGGGMTLISTSTANNTFGTVTFSSISGSYKHLLIIGQGLQSSSAGGTGISVTFNNDTGNNYNGWNDGTSGLSGSANANHISMGGLLAVTGDTSDKFANTVMWIYDYATAGVYHPHFIQSMGTPNGSSYIFMAGGQYNSTTAISRVDLVVTGGNNYKAGTLRLYGVN